MREQLPELLLSLAEACPSPLYLVGGSVRDVLMGFPIRENSDFDLASPASAEDFAAAAKACGFSIRAVYPRTGTVKISCGSVGCEFTRFRTDSYEKGIHAPLAVSFTEDIRKDARRRDFCANAVYYDIKKGEYLDPLGGITDIRKGILRTVDASEKVFGEDGLRLMRLARLSAQTGLSPDAECLAGASLHAALVEDIVPERVFRELELILRMEGSAVLRGLELLRDTGVLHHVLPELTLGQGMAQRKEFHRYDVLDHSLRCAAYAPPQIRFAALLHDVGKPACFYRDGNFYDHPKEGALLTVRILTRLKAPKALIAETAELVSLHMRDFDLNMRESKVRTEIITYYPLLEKLLALKQADYSACMDDLSPAPGVVKWRGILARMREEGVPFTVKELAVNGKELQKAGIPPERTGEILQRLLLRCAVERYPNTKEALLSAALKLCADHTAADKKGGTHD